MDGQTGLTNKDYTSINIDVIREISSELGGVLPGFLGAFDEKAVQDQTFINLKSIGISDALATGFDTAVESIAEHIKAVANSLKEYINQVDAAEKAAEEDFPEIPGEEDDNLGNTDEIPIVPGGATPSNTYNPSHAEFFKNISLSDLNYVLSVLNHYADQRQMSVDQLLKNVTSGDELKELLLAQPNISDELRIYLENTPGDYLLQDLQVVLFNPAMASSIFDFGDQVSSFFESFATTNLTNMDGNQSTPVSMEEVLGNPELLKVKLNRLNYYVTNTFAGIGEYDIQKVLLKLYDSGELTGNVGKFENVIEGIDKDLFVNYVRTEIESMANKNSVSCEELLTNEIFRKELVAIPNNLDKLLLYGETMARTSNPSNMWPIGEKEVSYTEEYYK